jgi:hypothetical protein
MRATGGNGRADGWTLRATASNCGVTASSATRPRAIHGRSIQALIRFRAADAWAIERFPILNDIRAELAAEHQCVDD